MEKAPSENFMVWNPDRSNPKVVHLSQVDAQYEAERLARIHKGQKFYVLAALGFAMVPEPPSIFTEFQIYPELPF